MWFLLPSAALAAGFYHPDDVMGRSARFAEAAETFGPIYAEAERWTRGHAEALVRYEEALDLLGDRAPAEERERLRSLRVAFGEELAVQRGYFAGLSDTFEVAFEEALERAVTGRADLVVCRARRPVGRPLPGLPVRTRSNPECEGEDHNGALATAVDRDPQLERRLRSALASAPPAPRVLAEARPPVGTGDRTVRVGAFVREAAGEDLRRIRHEDEAARVPFEAAVEQGADLSALRSEARAVTERTAEDRASLAAPLLATAEEVFARWERKGEPATAWCPNPPLLGGCTVADATPELLPRLLDDRRMRKRIR